MFSFREKLTGSWFKIKFEYSLGVPIYFPISQERMIEF